VTAKGNPLQTGFDGTASNRHLLHSFTGWPSGGLIMAAQLETRVKPLSAAENDTIALYTNPNPTTTPPLIPDYEKRIGTFGGITGLLPNPWNPSNYATPQLLTLTLNPAVVAAMNSSGVLDVQIQDDTSVDYLTLRLCLREQLPTPTVPPTPTPGNSGNGTAFKCPSPGMVKEYTAGANDNFAPSPEPAPSPRPAFVTAVGNPPQTGFDGTVPNQHLLHSFTGLPSGGLIVAAQLETRVKPLSAAENDDIALYSGTSPALVYQTRIGTVGSSTGLLPNPWNPSNYATPQLLTLTLNPSVVAAMNSSGVLDVQIEDDTSVDYLTLRLCLREILPTPTVVPPTPTPTKAPTPTEPVGTPPPSTHCDLQISKTIDTTSKPGVYVITVTVTNVGSGQCPSGETVNDPQPIGIVYTSAPSVTESGGTAGWTCTPTWQCGAANPLPPGYSATFTLTAQAKPGAQNCATVSDVADNNPQNNRACATVPDGQPPATPTVAPTPTPPAEGCHYDLAKQVVLTDGGNPPMPPQSGHPAKVTITLTNVGPDRCTNLWTTVTISDNQPSGMAFSGPFSANVSGWSCSFSGGQVLCNGPALTPGQSVTVTFNATVTGQLGSDAVRNCAGAKPMQIEACTLPEIP
jgi:hypothetical protein